MWAVFAQVSGLVGLALIGPLVIMLVCADQRPFAKAHATEALNFHITVLFGVLFGVLISLVLVFVFLLGVFTMIAIGIAALVYSILAAVAASKSETFRYPLTLRLVT